MNKKVIYIGVGAVVAYLLYKKFMASPKAEEVTAEEQPEEQAEEGGGGAPSGGGGGGSAPASKPTEKPMDKKSLQVGTKGRRPKPNERRGGLRPIGVKPMRPMQGMSKPMAKTIATPLPASKPIAKFAGFMDFDGFPDVQANIM